MTANPLLRALQPNTLFGRLFIGSVLALGLFFGFIAYILNQLALEKAYSDTEDDLRLQSYLLISSAQLGDGAIDMPEELREARFQRYRSGLYGFINSSERLLWQSNSSHSVTVDDGTLSTDLKEPGQSRFVIRDGWFIYHYAVLWELQNDQPEGLIFTVLEDSQPILDEVAIQQRRYRFWLLFTAIVLVIILLLVLHWGLSPLRRLAHQIKRIETGEFSQIKGDYPLELRTVTENIDTLLESEKLQRQRYHRTLADLAHSLKTPLAVIQTELNSESPNSRQEITAQTRRMNEIISHQLQRAVVVGSPRFSEKVAVDECVERLLTAMAKVYANKHISFHWDIAEPCFFNGDERDLMEVLGNLLDNACKACKEHVAVIAHYKNTMLVISIEDDGDGIDSSQRKRLLQRGQRADSLHSGQGIGLSVVTDIVDSYQGKLTIGASRLGGAQLSIRLPLNR